MEVVSIFEISNKKLYAAQFDISDEDALTLLHHQWNDVEYLRTFFKNYRKDYLQFYDPISINNIVTETLKEANELFNRLLKIANSKKKNTFNNLFKPLVDIENENEPYNLQKLKAKGFARKSYLRIYGIRFGDTIVITGGAIKLTDTMIKRKHTKFELTKLEILREYLDDKGDEGQFIYLDS